ncbi:unnamed protein product, partial [Closterium sp. NIES-54]
KNHNLNASEVSNYRHETKQTTVKQHESTEATAGGYARHRKEQHLLPRRPHQRGILLSPLRLKVALPLPPRHHPAAPAMHPTRHAALPPLNRPVLSKAPFSTPTYPSRDGAKHQQRLRFSTSLQGHSPSFLQGYASPPPSNMPSKLDPFSILNGIFQH